MYVLKYSQSAEIGDWNTRKESHSFATWSSAGMPKTAILNKLFLFCAFIQVLFLTYWNDIITAFYKAFTVTDQTVWCVVPHTMDWTQHSLSKDKSLLNQSSF